MATINSTHNLRYPRALQVAILPQTQPSKRYQEVHSHILMPGQAILNLSAEGLIRIARVVNLSEIDPSQQYPGEGRSWTFGSRINVPAQNSKSSTIR